MIFLSKQGFFHGFDKKNMIFLGKTQYPWGFQWISPAFCAASGMALIDLDRPPPWWSAEPIRRLTAQERGDGMRKLGHLPSVHDNIT